MSVYVRNLIINTHSDFSEDLELSQLAGKPTNLTGHTGASQMRKHPDSSTAYNSQLVLPVPQMANLLYQ